MFSGSMVALITPFKNGRVDEAKLRELVEWHIAEKTSVIVPVGTTGESATLSHKEHARVIEIVVKAARKRVPVHRRRRLRTPPPKAIDLTREAKRLGRGRCACRSTRITTVRRKKGSRRIFRRSRKPRGLPVVLYNIPVAQSAVSRS